MIMRVLMLICLVAFLGNGNLNAQDFEYVGAKKCKMCHNKPAKGGQYAQWLSTTHATAMESLTAEEAKNPACTKCHSTAGSVSDDLVATLTMKEGVSCESCHGPGSKYFPNAVMKNRDAAMAKGMILPTKEVCIKCHNKESKHYKGFNFEEATAKISHPNPAK